MRIARQKLLSTSLMQMQKLVGKLKKERIIVLLLSLLFMIVILAANSKWCLGELYLDLENVNKYFWMLLCDYISQVLKLAIIDVYMLVQFIITFMFFVKMKRERMLSEGLEFSRLNKFIVGWSLFLASANFFHSLSNIFNNILFSKIKIINDSLTAKLASIFVTLFMVPLIEFLTIATFLYLFYF
jgi:hypothetical protein